MVSLQASTPDSIALNQTYGFIYLKFRLGQHFIAMKCDRSAAGKDGARAQASNLIE